MSHRRAVLALLLLAACSKSEPGDIEMEVRTVGLDRMSDSPVVLLQDKQHRTALPIWIGPAEAQAIAMQLQGLSPPRPSTHDLMKNMLVESGVGLDRVVISDLVDRTYIAKIHLVAEGKAVELDSRPSDAIALAIRLKKPIFVARALMGPRAAIDIHQVFGSDTAEVRGLTVQDLTAELAELFDLSAVEGVLVSGVAPGIDALERGDRIFAVEGEPVVDLAQFSERIQARGHRAVRLEAERAGNRFEAVLPAIE